MEKYYYCTLAKDETRASDYFKRYFRTCPKKYLRWTLPGWITLWGFFSIMVLAAFVFGNKHFTPFGFLRALMLTVIYSVIWGIVFVYLVKNAWRFNLHRAQIKIDREMLVRVDEEQLALSTDSKRYIVFTLSPDLKKHKEVWLDTEWFGGYITDVYECEAGLYFWLFFVAYPAAFLAKNKFSEEEYTGLREMLKDKFKNRYHEVC